MTTKAAILSEIVSEPISDVASLPAPVTALRAKILDACAKGDVEALRIPIDWNEVRPLFGKNLKAGADPIEVLKQLSFDKKGAEILRIVRAVFLQPCVTVAKGSFSLYEWPAFVRRPTPPADDRELRARWRCVRFADLARSNAEGRPRPMKIGIAPDGVWHYFWNED